MGHCSVTRALPMLDVDDEARVAILYSDRRSLEFLILSLTSRATVQDIRFVFDSTSIERTAELRHSRWSRDTFLVTEQTVVELKAFRDACK